MGDSVAGGCCKGRRASAASAASRSTRLSDRMILTTSARRMMAEAVEAFQTAVAIPERVVTVHSLRSAASGCASAPRSYRRTNAASHACGVG